MKQVFYKGRFIFIPIAAAAFLSVISYIVMQLWNNLLPAIIHVSAITFWQAMGIFILCKILFGFGKGHHRGWGDRTGWMLRKKMEEKFKGMSPEEQHAFKQKMADKCGHWGGRHRGNWGEFDKTAEAPVE